MIIAVYGNSYKTTTAINLVTLLSRYNPGKDVVLVSLDKTQPVIPIIFPEKETEQTCSLGKLMSSPDAFSSGELICSINIVSPHIGVLGYTQGENALSYAPPLSEKIDDFFVTLRSYADFVVVDCTADVRSKFTAKALIHADKVLDIISCDVFGASWYCSQLDIVSNIQYKFDEKFLKIISLNNSLIPDENTMTRILGGKSDGIIPFSKEAVCLINEGLAFGDIKDKKYKEALCSIISKFSAIDLNYDAEIRCEDFLEK